MFRVILVGNLCNNRQSDHPTMDQAGTMSIDLKGEEKITGNKCLVAETAAIKKSACSRVFFLPCLLA